MIYYLIGKSNSGKSTYGVKLAHKLNIPFITEDYRKKYTEFTFNVPFEYSSEGTLNSVKDCVFDTMGICRINWCARCKKLKQQYGENITIILVHNNEDISKEYLEKQEKFISEYIDYVVLSHIENGIREETLQWISNNNLQIN